MASSTTRSAAVVLALVALAVLPLAAFAGPETNVSQGLTLAGAPLAIHGYDPVAFFTAGKAVLGEEAVSAVHDGAAYRFSSQANKQAFEADPGRYLPRYGGFCAYGAALGAKFDGDPRVFAIVDGKLYFNLSPDIQKKWDEDRAGNIRKGDVNWPKIRDARPETLGK